MRLVLKTCSYAGVHFVVATGVAYALTGSWAIALGIGLIEPLVQTFVFALHDWVWERKPGQGTPSPSIHKCALFAVQKSR